MIPRYSKQTMIELWSDISRYRTWLDIELAVCRAMEARGGIPPGITMQIINALGMRNLSSERISEIEQSTRHDVVAFLEHVGELVGGPARWLHLGLTSSDVTDTCTAIHCTKALDRILDGLRLLRMVCKKRAFEYKYTPIMGRSHGMHAEPITLGIVFLRWYAEVSRSMERIERARKGVAVGKISGAMGVYANGSPELEEGVLASFGLRPETVASQVVARDRHAEVFCALAIMGSACEQIATTVRHWQRTEVGEAQESFSRRQKGSSAMPHKRNPIMSENITGLARLLRTYTGAALGNIVLWHERDISHSSVERVLLPDATTLADTIARHTSHLVGTLHLHTDRMAQNMGLSSGTHHSQALLLQLVHKGLARGHAHDVVRECLDIAHTHDRSFVDATKVHTTVTSLLSNQELDSCFPTERNLQHIDFIFDRTINGC